VHQTAVGSSKELSNHFDTYPEVWPGTAVFDKTLLALTDFLPLFRWDRVCMNVRKAPVSQEASTSVKPGVEGANHFMKTIRFRLLIAALAVLLCGAIAKSQTTAATAPVHGHAFGMRGPMMGFFAKYLDLTDTQRAQMKAVVQKEHAAMKPQMQQLHQMQQQLKQYEEGTYDEAKVQTLVAQQAQTLVQLKVQETRIHNELFQLLTTDQQAKMKEFEANREARIQQRMQNAPPASEQQ
jgi:Spy/CpxP family protein refolding chaperone